MTARALLAVALLASGAAVAGWDLLGLQQRTLVVYTTPALRDLLEKDVVPRFEQRTGHDVALVYVPAGQQYNRLRMSPGQPEADVFLHASPLYLEKGFAEGHLAAVAAPGGAALAEGFQGRQVPGGHPWVAFAWSPLVEVYRTDLAEAPDLATSQLPFGFPHPVLSNNGVYVVAFFELASPEAGQRALEHTRVQPANARANIGGVADGSFGLTLGYEAVTLFYRDQGAEVAYDLARVDGQRYLLAVVCSAAVVASDAHPGARELVASLFTDATQEGLGRFHFRPTVEGVAPAPHLLPVEGAETLRPDWSRWQELEASLQGYVVQ